MVLCAGGVAISSDGLLVLRTLLFSLRWPDALHRTSLVSLFGRALAMPCGERCPLPALMFQTALSFPGSWASHCVRLCNSLGAPHCVQAWFQTHAPLLNRFLRDRLVAAASLLSVCHVRVSSHAVDAGLHQMDVLPFHPTLVSGGLLVGVMSFPGVEQRGTLVSLCRAFCVRPPSGDLFHCLSECPAFSDLRDQWCRQCSIHPDSVSFWARHPWLFLPSSSLNSVSSVRAHVLFVGQVCERFVSL